MSTVELDKVDPYIPIRFSRNYIDKPVDVQPYWIHEIHIKNFMEFGDIDMDVLGRPAITGPNGFGKTMILKLAIAVLDVAGGKAPTVLYQIVNNEGSYARIFDSFTVVFADGHSYTLLVEDASAGWYQFLRDGEFFMEIHDDKAVAPDSMIDADAVLLRVGRISKPEIPIYMMADKVDGKIDYATLNKWHAHLIQGCEFGATENEDGQPVVERYKDIPYSPVTGQNTAKAVLGDITRWLARNRFSHGEVELLLQMLTLTSGANVVLIDDAEIGLHMSVQMEYMRLMSLCYSKGIQVLYSTHSPEMFDGVFSNSNDLYDLTHPKDEE
jgi:hypothetical protein